MNCARVEENEKLRISSISNFEDQLFSLVLFSVCRLRDIYCRLLIQHMPQLGSSISVIRLFDCSATYVSLDQTTRDLWGQELVLDQNRRYNIILN